MSSCTTFFTRNRGRCDVIHSRLFSVWNSDTSTGYVTHLLDGQMAAEAAGTAPQSVKHGGVWPVTHPVSQSVSEGLNEELQRSLSSSSTDGIQRKTSDCRSSFLPLFLPLLHILLRRRVCLLLTLSLSRGGITGERESETVSDCGFFLTGKTRDRVRQRARRLSAGFVVMHLSACHR